MFDGRAFDERGRGCESADADRRLRGNDELSDQSRRRGESYDKLAKHEMHPPNAPIVNAPLARKMNGRAVRVSPR